MATNKQIIFDIGNNKVADQPKSHLGQQPVKPGPKSQLLERPKSSNLGVRVSIKQITKSPIPVVLPSTQPNQPVVALGQQIQPAGVLSNPSQAPTFNPATKHPVVINNPPITNITTYIPEQIHPAILPAPTKSATKLPTEQAITHPTINNNRKTQTIKPQNQGEHKTQKRKQKTKKQSKKPKTLKNNTNHIFNI